MADKCKNKKNEDIWREANFEPMTTFPRQKQLRLYMAKEGRNGRIRPRICHKHASAGKEKKGLKKRRRDNIRDDVKKYKMTEDMAYN